ncbi:DNA-binding protein [Bacteroidia bacterium]|nr:DNA-binding protein [Bacteroidia bacterium]
MELAIIQSKIYEIRGYRVMLDFDLAGMYGTETSQLKRSVKRNIERFEGDDFMFEISKEELSRCQIGTLKKGRGSNIKYLPYAFTELGVSMLSSVLNSKTAIGINRNIMRAFVAMRQLVLNPPPDELKTLQQEMKELKQYIEDVFTDYNDINDDVRIQIELINDTLAELQSKNEQINKPRNPVGYTAPQYSYGCKE